MYYAECENIKYEIFSHSSGKKIIIYLKKTEKGFVRKNKCFGTHYLEQIFDQNEEIIEENIKINPNYLEVSYSEESIDWD